VSNDQADAHIPLELTDALLKASMRRAMWVVVALALASAVLLLLTMGWQTALLLLIGAAIALSGLWEWQKLIALILAKLDVQAGMARPSASGARVIIGFLLRLVIAAAVLYVSLKSLHGSVYALLGGLALAMLALAIEAMRLIRS
jgi:hypothetical protein